MKCRPAPKDSRFNMRLNPEREKHKEFIDLLNGLPPGQKSEYVINAVLAYGQEDERLASLLRKIVREELQGVSFVSAPAGAQTAVPENNPTDTRTQRTKLDTEGLKNFFSSL